MVEAISDPQSLSVSLLRFNPQRKNTRGRLPVLCSRYTKNTDTNVKR